MPPKEKTANAEVQVFNLDNLNPALLPELSTFKEKQLQVAEENPFIAIIDATTRELAKKHRTARVSARTSLQSQDKLISSKFNEAKTKAKTYIAELIDITLPGELKQQNEINRDEAELEAKRQEKARIESQRIEGIKKTIDDYVQEWKTAFNIMSFESITQVSVDFLESYTSFNLTVLQEFEALFPNKIEELTNYLSEKTESLTVAENSRLQKLKIEEETKELQRQKDEFEAKQKAVELEQKRIADENLKISQENDRKLKEIADAQAKLDADKKLSEPKVVEEIIKVDGYSTSETTYPEKVETVEILEPVKTTANVCYYLPKEPNWESIEDDFKESGEKSYSKWLKSNYNVPTKIQ